MSRAFVKEESEGPAALSDLPISPHPNWVTPSGLESLRARLAARHDDLAALREGRQDGEDRLGAEAEAAARRDIRYLEARLASAILVEPAEAPDEVGFGTTVEIEHEDGARRTLRLVGEDEADPAAGLLSAHAPLARALVGAAPGDEVPWRGGSLLVVGVTA